MGIQSNNSKEEAASLLEPEKPSWACTECDRKRRSRQRCFLFSSAAFLILFLVFLRLLYLYMQERCPGTIWSPLTDVISLHRVRFNETFKYPTLHQSKFSWGISSENEWRKWTAHPLLNGRQGTIALEKSVVKKIATNYAPEWEKSLVQLSRAGETRYMGQIAMFHHLHCLNMLRHAVNPNVFNVSLDNIGHLEHCIESIREVLMCNTNGEEIIMFHWMEDSDEPYPDYNTYHYCRSSDEILDWALSKSVAVDGLPKKPAGAFAMSQVPY